MVTRDDFEKRYVASVSFHEGDEILITKENIEPLRKALKNTNFHWVSGSHIANCDLIQPEMFIKLDNTESTYELLCFVEDEDDMEYVNAINYVFVDY